MLLIYRNPSYDPSEHFDPLQRRCFGHWRVRHRFGRHQGRQRDGEAGEGLLHRNKALQPGTKQALLLLPHLIWASFLFHFETQGSRLTAYEFVEDGIPACLICDDMAAALMKNKVNEHHHQAAAWGIQFSPSRGTETKFFSPPFLLRHIRYPISCLGAFLGILGTPCFLFGRRRLEVEGRKREAHTHTHTGRAASFLSVSSANLFRFRFPVSLLFLRDPNTRPENREGGREGGESMMMATSR